MHEPATGELSAIRVALTAPVVFVDPNSAAHSPTFSAFAVTAAVVVSVVPEAIVTVRLVVVGVGDEDEDEPRSRSTDATVTVEPFTAVTLPATMLPNPARGAPEPVGTPLGRPPANPLGAPLGRAPPNPTPPAVQLPFFADVTWMVVAVIDADDVVVDVDRATMHEPTLIAASVVRFCCVIAVLAV